jgi:hypothetical protein
MNTPINLGVSQSLKIPEELPVSQERFDFMG